MSRNTMWDEVMASLNRAQIAFLVCSRTNVFYEKNNKVVIELDLNGLSEDARSLSRVNGVCADGVEIRLKPYEVSQGPWEEE